MTRFENALSLIDAYNSADPNTALVGDESISKELLYSQRMSQKLGEFAPQASEALLLAARAQHIGRWEIPRDHFPQDRKGYLQWRNKLKIHHAVKASKILKEVGYEPETVERVKFLIEKRGLKKDVEAQILEDVICLVFLQFYAADFAKTKSEEKMLAIFRKTWRKMSISGHKAALQIPMEEHLGTLVKRAI